MVHILYTPTARRYDAASRTWVPLGGQIIACVDGDDLRGACLVDQRLDYADLHGADLESAVLDGAGLTAADLSAANLRGARLRSARLGAANLRDAILVQADLRGATLRWAHLHGADLTGAKLDGASLRDAYYDERTVWPAGIDLVALGAAFGEPPTKEETREQLRAAARARRPDGL